MWVFLGGLGYHGGRKDPIEGLGEGTVWRSSESLGTHTFSEYLDAAKSGREISESWKSFTVPRSDCCYINGDGRRRRSRCNTFGSGLPHDEQLRQQTAVVITTVDVKELCYLTTDIQRRSNI